MVFTPLQNCKITRHHSFSSILLLLLKPPFFLGQHHRFLYLLFVNLCRSWLLLKYSQPDLWPWKGQSENRVQHTTSSYWTILEYKYESFKAWSKTWIVVVIKRCSVRLYLQLFVGWLNVLFTLFVLFADSGVQHILCCVLFCLSSSCVPYAASVSGLPLLYSLTCISLCKMTNI
jgi:hypothetical protein